MAGSSASEVTELMHALPYARMVKEQSAHPDINTWFDCGLKPGVLPSRLKELLEVTRRSFRVCARRGVPHGSVPGLPASCGAAVRSTAAPKMSKLTKSFNLCLLSRAKTR